MEFTVQLETNNSKVTQEKGRCKGDKWYQEMVPDAISLRRGDLTYSGRLRYVPLGTTKRQRLPMLTLSDHENSFVPINLTPYDSYIPKPDLSNNLHLSHQSWSFLSWLKYGVTIQLYQQITGQGVLHPHKLPLQMSHLYHFLHHLSCLTS